MARILGGITTSHIPAIGNAVPQEDVLKNDPYWKPFFDGYGEARAWLAAQKPDVVVMFYNDHGLNFFLDKMPTFAIGAAARYDNADEGWGIPTIPSFEGDPELSWHIINSVMAEDFDLTTCQEMLVDHGFTVPMSLFWKNNSYGGVKTVPVSINTVQHPMPSPMRCYRLGQAIGRALRSFPRDLKVVIFGTGGLSHQLDGERAGFINKNFDQRCFEQIVDAPEELAKMSALDLVREAGAQGAEFVNWLAMRGALGDQVKLVHRNYHIAISNTATGLLVLEQAAA